MEGTTRVKGGRGHMETVGLKWGLALSPEWLREQNSQTSEQLQAELRDYTCGHGNFAGRPLLRLDF